MCIMCIEIAKQNMKPIELARAVLELEDNDHLAELLDTIDENYEKDDVIREINKLIGRER